MPHSGAYQRLIAEWCQPSSGLPKPLLAEWSARCPACGHEAVWSARLWQRRLERRIECEPCGPVEWEIVQE